MALTEKGRMALGYINKYYPDEAFTAKELSDKCGVKIAGATLNSIVNNGYLTKLGGSPVQYQTINNFAELIKAMEEEKNYKSCTNTNLHEAKKNKNDEFYTRYEDIEAEVMKYREQFKDKIVYLPCDSLKSEFWLFFINNFQSFSLKKLIATHYEKDGQSYKVWTNDGDNIIQENLQGNGDFQSPECVAIMNECDIVCTNPPFSLFRSFVDTIMKANKKFLIIGNQNAFSYNEIFKLIKENKIWVGYTKPKDFRLEDGSTTKKINGLTRWFTNLTINKSNEEFVLTKEYNAIDYPKYDNYDAIEVDRIVNIPKDYYDVMGVPITFINKYNPNQFEILGHTTSSDKSPEVEELRTNPKYRNGARINGKEKYHRIFIRRRKFEN